ncbi:MAG: hypothetical protein AB1921_15580 [Thermodesulfobacteriota bacterium]
MKSSPLDHALFLFSSRSRFCSYFFQQADLYADENIPTLALVAVRNRMRLIYNPAFIAATDPEHLIGLLVHEILHIAANHPFRAIPGADPALQNLAQDMVVNSFCEKAARSFFAKKGRAEVALLLLPPGLPRVPEPLAQKAGGLFDLRWEEVYAFLSRKKGEEENGGEGPAFFRADRNLGGKGDAPEPPTEGMVLKDRNGKTLPTGVHLFGIPEEAGQARETARRVLRFAVLNAPAVGERIMTELSGLMGEPERTRVAWKARLRGLVRTLSPAARWDLSRSRPNRRFWDAGLVAPGRILRQDPAVTAVVDVSGSMAAQPGAIAAAFGVVEDLARTFPVNLLCLDQELFVPARTAGERLPARTARPGTYRRGDWKRLRTGSRGATFFAPLFNSYMPGRRGALVVLTDGEIYDMNALRPYPATVWVLPEDRAKCFAPPFGVTVAVPNPK